MRPRLNILIPSLAFALALAFLALGVDLAHGFQNGRAPQKALDAVYTPGSTAKLSKPAASAWNTMRLCSARAGLDIYPGPSQWKPSATAYRTYLQQVILWRLYQSGRGALAARPGTSNHGWGTASDLAAPAMRTYVDRHGRRFGWVKLEAWSEWWHVNYRGGFNRPNPGTSLRYPVLRRGSGGPCQAREVRRLQRRLHVEPDGGFGKGTSKAVRAYQRSHGLKPDGIVGKTTWKALDKQPVEVPARPPTTPHLVVTLEGASLVGGFEGLRLCPYRDVVGVWTIGYGHTAGVGPGTSCLTRVEAVKLLQRDLSVYAAHVEHYVKVKLTLRQYNALVSFVYNVGPGALADSTLLRELNQGHKAKAANQFKRWNRAGGTVYLGLTRRRAAECRMFRRGTPSKTTKERIHCG